MKKQGKNQGCVAIKQVQDKKNSKFNQKRKTSYFMPNVSLSY